MDAYFETTKNILVLINFHSVNLAKNLGWSGAENTGTSVHTQKNESRHRPYTLHKN